MPPDPEWRAAWETYQRRRWQYGAATGGFIVGFLGLAFLVPDKKRLFDHPVLFGTVFWLLLLSSIVTSWRLRVFRCPRCNERFAWRLLYKRLLTSRCLHCGIRVGEDPFRTA